MEYLSNAFSVTMLNDVNLAFVRVKLIEPSAVPEDVISIIGHPDTANILSGILHFKVEYNRKSILLTPSDKLYVAQYIGRSRLAEGTTELPEGAEFKFYEVTVSPGCMGCQAVDCNNCQYMDWLNGGNI